MAIRRTLQKVVRFSGHRSEKRSTARPNRVVNHALDAFSPDAPEWEAPPAPPPLKDLGGWFFGADQACFAPSCSWERVKPVLPDNGMDVRGTALLINGVKTPPERHRLDMQSLANTGLAVVGVHNLSRGKLVPDVVQCFKDKMGWGRNPTVDTLRETVLEAMRCGKPLHLVGHSQGALIIARALRQVRRHLEKQEGCSRKEVELRFRLLWVETHGGAAARYVNGPNYEHYVNWLDFIPMAFGVGFSRFSPFLKSGKGAQVRNFAKLRVPRIAREESWRKASSRLLDECVHGAEQIYFPKRAAAKRAGTKKRSRL